MNDSTTAIELGMKVAASFIDATWKLEKARRTRETPISSRKKRNNKKKMMLNARRTAGKLSIKAHDAATCLFFFTIAKPPKLYGKRCDYTAEDAG